MVRRLTTLPFAPASSSPWQCPRADASACIQAHYHGWERLTWCVACGTPSLNSRQRTANASVALSCFSLFESASFSNATLQNMTMCHPPHCEKMLDTRWLDQTTFLRALRSLLGTSQRGSWMDQAGVEESTGAGADQTPYHPPHGSGNGRAVDVQGPRSRVFLRAPFPKCLEAQALCLSRLLCRNVG